MRFTYNSGEMAKNTLEDDLMDRLFDSSDHLYDTKARDEPLGNKCTEKPQHLSIPNESTKVEIVSEIASSSNPVETPIANPPIPEIQTAEPSQQTSDTSPVTNAVEQAEASGSCAKNEQTDESSQAGAHVGERNIPESDSTRGALTPETSVDILDIKPAFVSDGVPVFKPSMEEFADFKRFVESTEKYGMVSGIIKIIPPQEWKQQLPDYSTKLDRIVIKNPIMQDVNGVGGVYKVTNIERQRTHNIAKWRQICEEDDHQPPARRGESRRKQKKHLSENEVRDLSSFDFTFDDSEFTPERCDQLEKAYWKSLTYSAPMYGADMPGSLFDDETENWNVANLDNLLNNLNVKIPGVNTAYLYCGMWKATFAWHLEDMDLASINYIHFGAPKQWYSIDQKDHQKFYEVMREMWPEEHAKCREFLRHKTFHASPSLLEQRGIKVNKVVHYQGEFMITFPYGYHSGFNYGYNVAESVNFAGESWIPIGRSSSKCMCISDSVGINVDDLVRAINGGIGSLPTPNASEDSDSDSETLSKIGNRKKRKRANERKSTRKKDSIKRIRSSGKMKVSNGAIVARPKLVPLPCGMCPDVHSDDWVYGCGVKVHRICALYTPETSINSDGCLEGYQQIPDERKAIRCNHCSLNRGSCFQCSYPTCVRAYHATCAAPAGVLVDLKSEVPFLCRFHRPKRDFSSESDKFAYEYAVSILPGEEIQCKIENGGIFAGIVEENVYEEDRVQIRLLPERNTTIEVEYRWIFNPGSEKERSAQQRLLQQAHRKVWKAKKKNELALVSNLAAGGPEEQKRSQYMTNVPIDMHSVQSVGVVPAEHRYVMNSSSTNDFMHFASASPSLIAFQGNSVKGQVNNLKKEKVKFSGNSSVDTKTEFYDGLQFAHEFVKASDHFSSEQFRSSPLSWLSYSSAKSSMKQDIYFTANPV